MGDNMSDGTGARSGQEPIAKRRKVRKGTRSCWECKRRKIRCIFSSSGDATCIGCQHRRTPCISQDLPEDLSPASKGSRHLGDRLARVEDAMHGLLSSEHFSGANTSPEQALRQEVSPSNPEARHASSYGSGFPSLSSSARGPLTPAESLAESASNSAPLEAASRGIPQGSEIEVTALNHLWAAFPSDADARILQRESVRPWHYTSLINFHPPSKLTLETLTAPFHVSDLPKANVHPVILAKCMLVFPLTLQSPGGENCLGLSEPAGALSNRLMAAATTWVTTKDALQGSIESLLCIILEGVYKVNCGDIRRAWAVFRRAMAVAQLMGLHRSPIPPLKRIEPELDVDPEAIWFRIVYMDRYLSLLLGLPQGTSDKSIGDITNLSQEPPLCRFEKQLTHIASYILDRNETEFAPSEISTTRFIDTELLKVSKSMPTSFWRPANFHQLTLGSPETLLETVRMAAQVYYYSLLLQVHLPYMMHGIDESIEQEYSKVTCVNASREILARFISHRSFNPMSTCSRPVDFFALIAAMTLLIAHLDAHHHMQAINVLAHQRLSDRAMLDQVLEKMDAVSGLDKDAINAESAMLTRRLLDLEQNAARGILYTTKSIDGDIISAQEEPESDNEELRLRIPYLGVVKIARQGPISRETWQDGTSPVEQEPCRGNTIYVEPLTVMSNPTSMPALSSEQSIPKTSETSRKLTESEPPFLGSAQDVLDFQQAMDMPDVVASADEWAFQGVDTAFFDTLMRGMPSVDSIEPDHD